MRKSILCILAALAVVFGTAQAQANLVTNGTFDTDLSGWDISGTLPTSPISGTAHIGRPGTPGTAIFSQDFDISAGTSAVAISFEYQWQVNPPPVPDTFTVEFIYQALSEVTTVLLSQSSSSVTFEQTIFFSAIVPLVDLAAVADNGTIRFTLDETLNPGSAAGTRIQLDNVSVTPVPLPAALPLLMGSLGILGLFGWRRSRAEA